MTADRVLAGELLDIAVQAAGRAKHLIHDERPSALRIGTKSTTTDNVTNMDLASEALIRSVITDVRPDDVIIGEESATEIDPSEAGTSVVTWIIDPIDGTTNYLYDLPGYNISIAAAIDGEVVVGVVADPYHDRIYHATKGGGAFCDDSRLSLDPVAPDASDTTAGRQAPTLPTALVATGFAYAAETRARQGRVVADLLPRVRDIRRLGAAALDLGHVAAGRVDAYFEVGLEIWDVAAGTLIATEAGAVVGPIMGGPDLPTSVVAAHPAVYDDLQSLLSKLGAGSVAG